MQKVGLGGKMRWEGSCYSNWSWQTQEQTSAPTWQQYCWKFSLLGKNFRCPQRSSWELMLVLSFVQQVSNRDWVSAHTVITLFPNQPGQWGGSWALQTGKTVNACAALPRPSAVLVLYVGWGSVSGWASISCTHFHMAHNYLVALQDPVFYGPPSPVACAPCCSSVPGSWEELSLQEIRLSTQAPLGTFQGLMKKGQTCALFGYLQICSARRNNTN